MKTLHSHGSEPSTELGAQSELPALTHSMLLVKRYQAGEQEALAQLLERYQDRIRRIVRVELGSRLRSCIESVDIVQDVNALFDQLGDLVVHDRASLLRWLSKIVLDRLQNTYGYSTEEGRGMDGVGTVDTCARGDAAAPLGRCSDSLPEERTWRKELLEIFDDSVAKLPCKYRAVILRRDYYSEAWPRIAEELGYAADPSESDDPRGRLRTAVNAAQECHRRAWIRLRRMVRPRLDGLA